MSFEDGYYTAPIRTTYENYLAVREEIFAGRKDKYVCLMDLALRWRCASSKKDGRLEDMEKSDRDKCLLDCRAGGD